MTVSPSNVAETTSTINKVPVKDLAKDLAKDLDKIIKSPQGEEGKVSNSLTNLSEQIKAEEVEIRAIPNAEIKEIIKEDLKEIKINKGDPDSIIRVEITNRRYHPNQNQ